MTRYASRIPSLEEENPSQEKRELRARIHAQIEAEKAARVISTVIPIAPSPLPNLSTALQRTVESVPSAPRIAPEMPLRDEENTLFPLLVQNVQRLRAERGWTQAQGAEACEMNLPAYAEIEEGKKEIFLSTLSRLLKGYGVTPNDLLQEPPKADTSETMYEVLLSERASTLGFRSSVEEECRWAALFQALGVKWKHRGYGEDLSKTGLMIPSFWLTYETVKPDPKAHPQTFGLWLDILPKGTALSNEKVSQVAQLAQKTRHHVLIVSGTPDSYLCQQYSLGGYITTWQAGPHFAREWDQVLAALLYHLVPKGKGVLRAPISEVQAAIQQSQEASVSAKVPPSALPLPPILATTPTIVTPEPEPPLSKQRKKGRPRNQVSDPLWRTEFLRALPLYTSAEAMAIDIGVNPSLFRRYLKTSHCPSETELRQMQRRLRKNLAAQKGVTPDLASISVEIALPLATSPETPVQSSLFSEALPSKRGRKPNRLPRADAQWRAEFLQAIEEVGSLRKIVAWLRMPISTLSTYLNEREPTEEKLLVMRTRLRTNIGTWRWAQRRQKREPNASE